MMTNNYDLRDIVKCIILFLFTLSMLSLLMLTTGCKTVKNVDKKSEEVAQKSHDSVINGITFDKKWFESYLEQVTESNEQTKIIIYDTSLPVNIETDRCPVLAEIEKKTVVKENTVMVEKDYAESVCEVEANVSEDSTVYKHDEIVEEIKTGSVSPKTKIYLFFGLMVMCLIMALWGKHLLQDGTMWVLRKLIK